MDNIPLGLTLDDTRVRISPVVPSVILNYFNSYNNTSDNEEQARSKDDIVFGVLIGLEIDSNIILTNAFGIDTREEESKLNSKYIKSMKKFLTKGTKDSVVGMFFAPMEGQAINDISVMRAFATISKEFKNKGILLTLDKTSNAKSLDITTYLPLDVDFGETAENLVIFSDTPHEIITESMAEAIFGGLIQGTQSDVLSVYWKEVTQSEEITLAKLDEINEKLTSLSSKDRSKMDIEEIIFLLSSAKKYIEESEAGKVEREPSIDKALNSALCRISNINTESIYNPQPELGYISKLTTLYKQQLEISHKVNKDQI